jgi:hypothetical protein
MTPTQEILVRLKSDELLSYIRQVGLTFVGVKPTQSRLLNLINRFERLPDVEVSPHSVDGQVTVYKVASLV